jgi:hypothetical protein
VSPSGLVATLAVIAAASSTNSVTVPTASRAAPWCVAA